MFLPSKILKENLLFIIILFITTICLYANTINGQFLTADDVPGIVNNPMVKNWDASIKTMELEKIYPAVIYKFFGMNPIPYHFFSITMHFVVAVTAFVFVFILFGKTEAVIATLIFLLHPINTEAVSWISAYGYLVYTFATLVILIFYYLWQKTNNKNYLVYALIIFVLTLWIYRKPWVALIPAYIVLIDQLIVADKISFKKFKEYLLFGIPTLIYLFVWVKSLLVVRSTDLVNLYYNRPEDATPYFNRVLYTIFMTAKLLVAPIALTIYHEGEPAKSLTDFTIKAGLVTLGIVITTLWLFFSKSKTVETKRLKKNIGTLILLIYTSMAFSFYFEVVVWAMAERYLYLGSIFFAIIVALLYKKVATKNWAKYVLAILFVLYSIKTFARTFDWKSSKSLWIATQKVSPYSYRVYNNLGDVYSEEGNYEEAIRNFQISLQLSPTFADAVHNLGYTYYQIGNIEQAKLYLQKSFEMNPLLYQATYKLGVIAYQQGDAHLARDYFIKTLEINPNFDTAKQALGFLDTHPLPNQ